MTDLLTRRIGTGLVIQELGPIWKSLPWLRSQRYWARAGVEVFTSGEVPYVATNDGEHSRKALEVYLTSLRAADERGDREPTSYVLEMGVGSGLFAKLFLDQLRDRSRASGTRDYDRTRYLVCDNSPRLLEDTRQSGVFADHEDRIERMSLPSQGLRAALAERAASVVGTIRTVHANYVLDSLPFTILSHRGPDVFELHVRTRLREGVRHPGGTPPPAGDLEALCVWLDELGDGERPSAHHALVYEGEYVRVDRDQLPYSHLIASPAGVDSRLAADGSSSQLIHSFGAAACLEEIVTLLRADGYFIAMDYGYQGASTEPVEFQCFGTSIAAGVNFEQLERCAHGIGGVIIGTPDADPDSLHARAFARVQTPSEVVDRFRALYSKAVWEAAEAPYHDALDLQQRGQYEAARWKFEAAQRLQPYNWSLMETIVTFLSYTLSEHQAGLELAKRALRLNHLSPRLWSLLGDCYYGLEELESAEESYLQAARLNPVDVRARANLIYIHLRRGMPAAALRTIGEALALDRAGDYRDELLTKQNEAFQAMASLQAGAALGKINRLSGHHALPGRTDR